MFLLSLSFSLSFSSSLPVSLSFSPVPIVSLAVSPPSRFRPPLYFHPLARSPSNAVSRCFPLRPLGTVSLLLETGQAIHPRMHEMTMTMTPARSPLQRARSARALCSFGRFTGRALCCASRRGGKKPVRSKFQAEPRVIAIRDCGFLRSSTLPPAVRRAFSRDPSFSFFGANLVPLIRNNVSAAEGASDDLCGSLSARLLTVSPGLAIYAD